MEITVGAINLSQKYFELGDFRSSVIFGRSFTYSVSSLVVAILMAFEPVMQSTLTQFRHRDRRRLLVRLSLYTQLHWYQRCAVLIWILLSLQSYS